MGLLRETLQMGFVQLREMHAKSNSLVSNESCLFLLTIIGLNRQ